MVTLNLSKQPYCFTGIDSRGWRAAEVSIAGQAFPETDPANRAAGELEADHHWWGSGLWRSLIDKSAQNDWEKINEGWISSFLRW